MKNIKLSIIIPCFNECRTIKQLLEKVHNCPVKNKEIIIVDDCSTDGTKELLHSIKTDLDKVFFHSVNRGKGAAIRTGLEQVSGDVIIFQDADLEYDPSEYKILLNPIETGNADVVYGSRFRGGEAVRVLYFWHKLGNQLLTLASNMLTNFDQLVNK